jgi:hypothetical protein
MSALRLLLAPGSLALLSLALLAGAAALLRRGRVARAGADLDRRMARGVLRAQPAGGP